MTTGATLKQNTLILEMHMSMKLNGINPRELWRIAVLELIHWNWALPLRFPY